MQSVQTARTMKILANDSGPRAIHCLFSGITAQNHFECKIKLTLHRLKEIRVCSFKTLPRATSIFCIGNRFSPFLESSDSENNIQTVFLKRIEHEIIQVQIQ